MMHSGHAEALAQLLPILGCGEEAAALSFDRLGVDPTLDAKHRRALAAIGGEEAEHDRIIAALRASLPAVPLDKPRLRETKRMHFRIGDGNAWQRLARIAALDAAVCTILSAILTPGRPVSQVSGWATVLGRIRHDEARHVRLTRAIVIERTSAIALAPEDEALWVREGLAGILENYGSAFEQLGVDASALMRKVRSVPQGLYRAS